MKLRDRVKGMIRMAKCHGKTIMSASMARSEHPLIRVIRTIQSVLAILTRQMRKKTKKPLHERSVANHLSRISSINWQSKMDIQVN